MAVLRFVAFLLIVSALMLLGADVVSMLESGEPKMRSIDLIWDLFAAGGAETFQTWAQTALPGPLPEGLRVHNGRVESDDVQIAVRVAAGD